MSCGGDVESATALAFAIPKQVSGVVGHDECPVFQHWSRATPFYGQVARIAHPQFRAGPIWCQPPFRLGASHFSVFSHLSVFSTPLPAIRFPCICGRQNRSTESFASYRKHLKPDGQIVVHITNHFLDLELVACRLAAEFGFAAERHELESGEGGHPYATLSIVLTPLPADAVQNATAAANERLGPLWTDHYSSLWQVLKRDP